MAAVCACTAPNNTPVGDTTYTTPFRVPSATNVRRRNDDDDKDDGVGVDVGIVVVVGVCVATHVTVSCATTSATAPPTRS
jgi:hypothetical protein